jgi:hypothetical protein
MSRTRAIDLPYPPPFMTAEVLARHLCISVETVETWTLEGILPQPIKPKGVRLWQWRTVEAVLDGRPVPAVQCPSSDPFVAGAQREASERKRHGRAA